MMTTRYDIAKVVKLTGQLSANGTANIKTVL